MALTVCRHCGKKVSDTVDTCIHCGGLIAEPVSEPETVQEEITPPVAPKEEKKTSNTAYDYYVYSDERRLKLEESFLKTDPWARKYRYTEIELRKFRDLCGSVFFGMFLGALGLWLLYVYVFEMKECNVDLVMTTAKIAGVVAAVDVLCWIVLGILHAVYRNSDNKLIYLKRYKRWLLKEKDVSFNPNFAKKSDQQRFKEVDPDDIIE